MININKIIHCILIYLLIIFQGSIFFKNNSEILYILVLIIAFIFLLIRPQIYKGTFILYLGGLFLILICVRLISGGSLSIASILNVISRFLLAYLAYYYNKKDSLTLYVKFIIVLSELSLIGYVIQIIYPELLKDLLGTIQYGFYGGLFFTWAEFLHPNRNIGILAEPGLYAIILIIALYILLYFSERVKISAKKKNYYTIILLITIITVQSTTGYICTAILLLLAMLDKKNIQLKRMKKYIILLVLIFISVDIIKGEDGLIYNNLISKVIGESGNIDLNVSTGKSRLVSIRADLQIVRENPFGIGYKKYETSWRTYLPEYIPDTSSCVGLTKTMATLGIPATIYIFLMYIYMVLRSNKSFYCKVSCLFLFISISLSQPQILFPAFIYMFLLGENINECRRM